MKIVLAPDKFKGSLTGNEFCDAVTNGIKKRMPFAEIIRLPLADGGDGTIEILADPLQGELISMTVNNPLFRPIKATYLWIEAKQTAFIEMAEASGMKLLKSGEQNCRKTTTFGTGEMILSAIEKGAKTIILGIGGSATNDCGIGMATALGYKFLDENGQEIVPIGENLSKIQQIETKNVHQQLHSITFQIACDVTNPLHGLHGAAYVYAAQKGASKSDIELLNNGLIHISKILQKQFNIDVQHIEGSGAAGGMGAGTTVFLNGQLTSGIKLVKELVDFDQNIKNADWIITGEGKLDAQTFSGKTIIGVIESAKKQQIPVAVFCGKIELHEKAIHQMGIQYAAALLEVAKNQDDAIQNPKLYLEKITENFTNHILKTD